jgi:hypothetical protein
MKKEEQKEDKIKQCQKTGSKLPQDGRRGRKNDHTTQGIGWREAWRSYVQERTGGATHQKWDSAA